jgi:ribose/xylose/arabinose/galactoside ABC-type transport system permease subunit
MSDGRRTALVAPQEGRVKSVIRYPLGELASHPLGQRLVLWPTAMFARFGALPVMLVGMILYFQAVNSVFLSGGNLSDVLSSGLYLLLIAVGQAVVLISGGFDLSVSSNVALTSVWSAMLMTNLVHSGAAASSIAGAGLAIAVGVGIGIVNGAGVAIFKINPFIMTLASASVIQGLTLQISQGEEITGLPSAFVNDIGSGTAFGLPMATYIVVPIVLIVFVLSKLSRYGRQLYAVGSNPRASLISGIPNKRILIGAYVLCAVLTAIAGYLLTAYVATGDPTLGGEYQLESITAAVLGGVSLRGGEGGVGGTALGVAFVVFLANGMNIIRLGSNQELIALGAALAVAVMLDGRRQAARAFVLKSRQMSRTTATTKPGDATGSGRVAEPAKAEEE